MYILSIFLKFRQTHPQYSYKNDFYKKKKEKKKSVSDTGQMGCVITVITELVHPWEMSLHCILLTI